MDFISRRWRCTGYEGEITSMSVDATVTLLDAQLPQLQCGRCGYAGCQPYAKAIVEHQVSLDKCLPGGAPTQIALATIMQTSSPQQGPTATPELAQFVRIETQQCIGCHLCVPVCPVDAIVGSLGQLHVSLTDVCTGCGLCLPVCPTNCIDLHVRPENISSSVIDNPLMQTRAESARIAYTQRNARLARASTPPPPIAKTTVRAEIRAALSRAQQKRAPDGP